MEILEKLRTPLHIADVDFRIQSINKGGYATILAYKDARTDMNRLDKVCGTNWQKDYKTIDGSLYCGIGIKMGNEWLWRWDVGTESFSDKEKDKASDAFKKAGFCWGIGRELYDYPLIQVKLKAAEFTVFKGDNRETGESTYNLSLKNWSWEVEFNDKYQVSKLTAVDEKGLKRYSYKINETNAAKPVNHSDDDDAQKEKAWLNRKDDKENFTGEWLSVVNAIGEGRVTSVDQVKNHYKVSMVTAKEIQKTINLTAIN